MYRIGNGLDFHKLTLDANRFLVLGGHKIESEYALIGHSDADILLHAISDAILGALGKGDIGEYFPDTDPQWKNMDSVLIINKCISLMHELGYTIVNLDSTFICERPKITPHKTAIRVSLSKILNLSVDCISIKATTTEKMGSLGRMEGVGVISSILLVKTSSP